MRFKARIGATAGVHNLTKFIQIFSKLSKVKECRVRFTPESIHFVVTNDAANDVRVWSELQQRSIFDEYKLQSMHDNNEILIEIQLDSLLRVIKSAFQSSDVLLKLVKKDHTTYLNVLVTLPSPTGITRPLSHDIPVTIFPFAEIEQCRPPELPNPEVALDLPEIKVLRTLVDRIKTMSEYVLLAANNIGDLIIKAETGMVSVKTFFRDLNVVNQLDSAPNDEDNEELVEARIYIKKLSTFLAAAQSMPNPGGRLMLTIAKEKAVVLFMISDEIVVTYYIPVVMF
eukprot:m.92038 g.92038  ORF g.92038 m.92038 type:complete len:285 (+) comp21693_c0_seq2:193-1047(+)